MSAPNRPDVRCGDSTFELPQHSGTRFKIVLILLAVIQTCRTRFELWLLGYDWARRMIPEPEHHAGRHVASDSAMEDIRGVCQFVNSVGARLSATCLVRSMTAQRILASRGVPSAVCIGVIRDETTSELNAHAWLESFGQVINDDPETVSGFNVLRSTSNTHA